MNWDNFFIAEAGAAASLTGLIFVGVSINLSGILATSYLPYRALQSLILLLNILVVASLLLVPGQPDAIRGMEVLSIAIVAWAFAFGSHVRYNVDRRHNTNSTRWSILFLINSQCFRL